MNERIRKLYEQANIRHTNDYALSGKPREEWRSIPDLFAELIVRECAKYVDVMWPHQKEFKGTLDVGKGLKAKFGVEE
jgi:hypothetical protein